MKVISFLLALALPLVYAAECTDTDVFPLATSVLACASASGTTFNTSSFNVTTAAALCQYSDCQTLLKSVGALTCTVSGESLTAAATLCSSTTTTAPSSGSSSGSTPITTSASSGSSSGSTPTTTASTDSSTTTTTAAPTSAVGATVLSSVVAMIVAVAII